MHTYRSIIGEGIYVKKKKRNVKKEQDKQWRRSPNPQHYSTRIK